MENKLVTFDSEKKRVYSDSYLVAEMTEDNYILFNIAHGYISTTEVCFDKENIKAMITAVGDVSFFDKEDKLLASACVSASDAGSGRYDKVSCKVDGGKIFIRFPLYEWYDNYPNCDGESDRWDSRLVGYKDPVVFCINTCTVE